MIPPVCKTLRVPLPPARAFSLFTEGLASWWPLASHSVFLSEFARLDPPAGPDGVILEHATDGRTCPWGRVLRWEPPVRVVMTFGAWRGEARAMELEVRFTADGTGTRVELEHRAWEHIGPEAEEVRAGYDPGWDFVFGSCYGAAAGV